MKFLFLTLFFFAASAPVFSCEPPKDASETVVMVDYNFILQEVESAKKAACESGKGFVVLPHGYDYHKKVGDLREKIYRNQSYRRNNNCEYLESDSATPRCKRLIKEAGQLNLEMNTEQNWLHAQVRPSKLVDAKFKELAGKDKSVNSIVLSGHDGSGSFHGIAGGGDKRQIVELLKDAYKDKPELLEQLNSVYLWGCYTATRAETDWWSKNLPSLNIVGGFHGTGPSIGKTASNQMLYDLMSSEEEIARVSEENRLEGQLKGLDGLPYLLSGIYVKNCNEDEYYLSRQKSQSGDRLVTSFGPTGEEVCKERESENKELHSRFMKYFNGELPIPKDTQNGELRRIYNFSRAWEHCGQYWDAAENLKPDQVALLLFFDGVKANFYNSFRSEIQAALKAFQSLPMGELDFIGKDKSFFEWLPEKLRYEASKGLQGEKHKKLADFVRKYEGAMRNLPSDKESFMELSRKDFNEYNKMLHELTSTNLHLYPGVKKKTKALKRLKKAMNIYGYGLDSSCMNMLMWHEDINQSLYNPAWSPEHCSID